MHYQVIFSEQAVAQLRDIGLYLRHHVSKEYAIRMVREIQTLVKSLEEMPQRYAYARNIVLKRQGFRCAVCEKYLIFYKVHSHSKVVQIYAIVNGTQDYISLVL